MFTVATNAQIDPYIGGSSNTRPNYWVMLIDPSALQISISLNFSLSICKKNSTGQYLSIVFLRSYNNVYVASGTKRPTVKPSYPARLITATTDKLGTLETFKVPIVLNYT